MNDRCGLLIQRLEEQVLECLALNKRFEERIYIHGDLGNWNLIFGRAGVRIIDFGEARLGSRHFDLAALLTSTTDAEDRQASRYLSAYLEGYTRHADGFKASVLAEQIRLWNVRGAVALLESIGVNERSVRYAERVLKQSEVWAKRLC